MENWRDVVGYEDKYLVSDIGNVRSIRGRKNRVLNPFTRMGYPCVRLGDGKGNITNFYVHRLVAAAFIGEIKKGMVINHKDGNKTNNLVDNLEIVTMKENIVHGINVLGNKLIPVYMMDRELNILAEFPSIKEAQLLTGINDSSISEVCRGRRKTAGGYVWKKK